MYSPAYNLAFTALVYSKHCTVILYHSLTQWTGMQTAYLVELFPFYVRARGITIYQWWCRSAGFLNQVVDPIGIDVAGASTYSIHLTCSKVVALMGHDRLEMVHHVSTLVARMRTDRC